MKKEMTQETFGDWCIMQYCKLEHLACGVPEEYEAEIVAQADSFFKLAAKWGQPEAVRQLEFVNDPALKQRDFFEIAEGFV